MHRRLLATLTALSALAAAAPAAAAPVVGLSEQRNDVFGDPRLLGLGLRHARLVVPWDAATSEPLRVRTWLAATAAAGMQPHIAFEHARGTQCPNSPCGLPSRAQARSAFAAFRAAFPQVTTFTTWNEANHRVQPTADAPEAVAAFHADQRAACPACTIVAGDVVDAGSYVRWLERFLAASPSTPQLWGVHNYGDVTYGRTTGTDDVLETVPGEVWVEETGGIVTLRNAAGQTTLSSNESRAAASMERAFDIAQARPRITRMYLFHWRGYGPRDTFDSGLVRPDGTARPSLAVAQRRIAALRAASAATSATAPRFTASWRADGRLRLRVRCTACSGRVTVVLRTKRGGRWRATTLASRRTYRNGTVVLAVSQARRRLARRAAARRLRLTVTPAVPAGARTTVTTSLARPR